MKALIFLAAMTAGILQAQDFRGAPRAATQAEVDAGREPRAYVSPATLSAYSGLGSGPTNGLTAAQVATQIAASNLVTQTQLTSTTNKLDTDIRAAIGAGGVQLAGTNTWTGTNRFNLTTIFGSNVTFFGVLTGVGSGLSGLLYSQLPYQPLLTNANLINGTNLPVGGLRTNGGAQGQALFVGPSGITFSNVPATAGVFVGTNFVLSDATNYWTDHNIILDGGAGSTISNNSSWNFIGGGENNTMGQGVHWSVIVGGKNNRMQYLGDTWGAFIGGGENNMIEDFGQYAVLGGGKDNTIGYLAAYSTIPGGQSNRTDGTWSFAAGFWATAAHPGAFVWSDSGASNFTSTADNQFRVRARGGVDFETFGAGLLVDGAPVAGSGAPLAGTNTWTGTNRFNLTMLVKSNMVVDGEITGPGFTNSVYEVTMPAIGFLGDPTNAAASHNGAGLTNLTIYIGGTSAAPVNAVTPVYWATGIVSGVITGTVPIYK